MTDYIAIASQGRHYRIAVDGACIPNPGPGGWGALLQLIGEEGEVVRQAPLAGHVCASTTNNKMELTAAIRALGKLRDRRI